MLDIVELLLETLWFMILIETGQMCNKSPVGSSLNKQEWRDQYLSSNKCNATHNKGDQNKYRPVFTALTLHSNDR